MKAIHSLLLLFSIFVATVACQKDDIDASCVRWCDIKTQACVYSAEVHECSIASDVLSEYTRKCRSDCVEVLDYFVDDEYRPSTVDCLDCIYDEVKDEPTDAAIAQARDGVCYPLCKEPFADQFFYSFYVSPPEWECSSE
ncbi:MAG: hypothetical protein MUC50_16675 [Myxococcota bacterium]|nr:hypothetical protein [Myxococcota bacterium]